MELVETPNVKTQLGMIPSEWEIVTLGAAVEFLDEKRKPIKSAERAKMKGVYPYYGASGIIDYVNDYLFNDELILLGEDGENIISRSVRLAFRVSGKIWVNNHAHVLKPNPDFEIGFLTEYLESIDYRQFNSGTAQPKLNKATCKRIPIIKPTLAEQKAIATALSDVDALITGLDKLIEKKKAIKQGAMQELLTGKIRLDGFGDGVGYKMTEVGRIPEDWELIKLSDCTLKVGSGITPTGGEKVYLKAGRPFVRSQNIGWGLLLKSDLTFISDEIHSQFDSTEIHEDDVLLNITGASIGRCAKADKSLIGGNVNQHVCIVRPITATLNSEFLKYVLLSKIGQKQIDSFQAGGNRQGLNFQQIRSFQIPLPPTLSEQKTVAESLSNMDSEINVQISKREKYKLIKQGMMQELLTGKIRLI